jgi:hypothetical protein
MIGYTVSYVIAMDLVDKLCDSLHRLYQQVAERHFVSQFLLYFCKQLLEVLLADQEV